MGPTDAINWDDLRYFLRAAQAKTLAGAARALNVEHTTVGRRLTTLERSLGAALFLRGPEGLSLTPLGERVSPLVLDLEHEVQAIMELAATQIERVRLAVPSGFTNFFTPRIAQLRQAHPRLSLELLSGARMVDLKLGEADLAVRVGRIDNEDLVARKLAEVGWSLYASPAYLARRPAHADPTNLAGHEVIGYGVGLSSVTAAKWLNDHVANATIVLRANDSVGMLEATMSGVGLALLPCYLGDPEPRLIRLTPDVLATRNVSLVYRREARLAGPVRAVIGFVVDAMLEHERLLSGIVGGTGA
ncbi:MAG TPA: LysR family transcriptional regulator [Rhizobacter sp.]|nr:LysR family transcriptional regulator [Rhizobacter sp.]